MWSLDSCRWALRGTVDRCNYALTLCFCGPCTRIPPFPRTALSRVIGLSTLRRNGQIVNSCVYFTSRVLLSRCLYETDEYLPCLIGRIRFGKYSASRELPGPVDFETSDMGAWELVRFNPQDSMFCFH